MNAAPNDAAAMRQAAEQIVRRLREAGHTAYFAGGCVRDQIMGRVPDDYDIATDAHPPRVLELFPGSHYVGEAFGVVMVRRGGVWVEVATFRLEWEYLDGRRPARVEFTDAENDARRRDFTVNGLFYDPVDDRVIDYVDGRADIASRTLRAIGDPAERFGEDYLRMLRAVRFAAKLDFAIEPATAAAIGRLADRLDRISRERIGAEISAMLAHSARARAVHELESLGLDRPVFGSSGARREKSFLKHLPVEAGLEAALAAWMLDRALPDTAFAAPADLIRQNRQLKPLPLVEVWRGALVLSNRQRDRLEAILTRFGDVLHWFDLGLAAQKRLLALEIRPDLEALMHAADECQLLEFSHPDFQQQVQGLLAEGVAPQPLISGSDLIAAGLEPGPGFRSILDRVYDAQLEGRVHDREQALSLARIASESLE